MIPLDKVPKNKIIFRKDILLYEGNKKFKNAIFYFGNTKEKFEEIYKNDLFNLSYYQSTYIPKILQIKETNKRKRLDRDKYYTYLDTKIPQIKFKKIDLKAYSQRNLIFDTSLYFNFHRKYLKKMGKKKINSWQEMVYDYFLNSEELKENYDTYIFMYPLDFNFNDFDTVYTKLTHPNPPTMNINSFTQFYNFIQTIIGSPEDKIKETSDEFKLKKKIKDTLKNKNIYFILFDEKRDALIVFDREADFQKMLAPKIRTLVKMHIGNLDFSEEEMKEVPELQVTKSLRQKIAEKIGIEVKDAPDDENEEREEVKEKIVEKKPNYKYHFDFVNKIKGIFTKNNLDLNKSLTVSKLVKNIETKKPKTSKELTTIIKSDEDYQDAIKTIQELKSKENKKTNKELTILRNFEKEQKEVKIDDKKLNDILNDLIEEDNIESEEIKSNSLNKFNKKSSSITFTEVYNKSLYKKDLIKTFAYFSDKRVEDKYFIKNVKIEDVSDEQNFVERWQVTYSSLGRRKTTISLLIPILFDNNFIFINSSKKIIENQIVNLPIVKNDPNSVIIATNYNKLFIETLGTKFNPRIEKIKKYLEAEKDNLKKSKLNIIFGDNFTANNKFINTLEYNYLSKFLFKITDDDDVILFNRETIKSDLYKIKLNVEFNDNDYFPLGYNLKEKILYLCKIKDGTIYVKNNKKEVLIDDSLTNFLVRKVFTAYDKNAIEKLNNITVGKAYMYSLVKILNRKVPMIILLSFYIGFLKILDMYNIKYTLVKSKRTESSEDLMNYRYVKFKDVYLKYKAEIKNELLMNGLFNLNLNEIELKDMEDEKIYFDYFEEAFRSRNVGKGFRLILNRMMDPISEEICTRKDIPSEIEKLILVGNDLLADMNYKTKTDMSQYRIRNNEIIAGHLYKVLAYQYNKTIHSGEKFTLPESALIKSLLEDKLVSNHSILNPNYEMNERMKASWRGLSGVNMDENNIPLKDRMYDDSMKGIFSPFTPETSAGTVRELSQNANIKNARGFLEIREGDDSTSNLSFIENSVPYSAAFTDPARLQMVSKQNTHVIPTNKMSVPMIGTGYEKVISNFVSSDFVVTAKGNGYVKEMDLENNLMIIEYTDKDIEDKIEVIDISERVSKNSQSGFYTNTQVIPKFKEGQKFKKGDDIASNKNFFIENIDGLIFSQGTLAKVAVLTENTTLEDASLITKNFADKIGSTYIMEEEALLSNSVNIEKIVKVGDKVNVGDPLIVFEEIFDSKEAINLLNKLGEKYREEIDEMSKTTKKSHYPGEIIDIKIYYNKPIAEYTPNVQSILKKYIKHTEKRIIKINKLNMKNKPNIELKPIKPIKYSKVGTLEFDGLLIKFFVKMNDKFKIGDKVNYMAANKSIISTIIPEGLEPYSEYRPDEIIDSLTSPLSIISRKTVDIYLLLFSHKILKYLKDQCRDIFEK